MNEPISVTITSGAKPGRPSLWLGLAIGLLAPALYLIQVRARLLTVPWYLPILGTVAAAMVILALCRARSLWRILGLVLLVLLAAGEWLLVVSTKLPAYSGPVVAGGTFPEFTATLADGSPFRQSDLRGPKNTVMVFFRGRW